MTDKDKMLFNTNNNDYYEESKSVTSRERNPPKIDFSSLQGMKSEDSEQLPNIDFDSSDSSFKESVSVFSSDINPPQIDFSSIQRTKSRDSEPPPNIDFDLYKDNYYEETKSTLRSDRHPPKIDFSSIQGMKSEESDPPPNIFFPTSSTSLDSEESLPYIPFDKYLESRKSPIQSPKVFHLYFILYLI